MSMEQNSQLELAFNFVQYTDKNIFLTGKAGTGKTTFLHQLKKQSHKRMAVVAPTGVAAINAGGVTINSFFQLPFGPYIPNNNGNVQVKRFNKEKINLIKSLDLLVIDEISMVRADTLDHIDEVLRKFKNHHKPFGGVQVLMIGDLHQLSPVVKDEDWLILKNYYSNLFFFSSKALQQTSPVSIELKHIYRQVDTMFIDLLNSVRKNEIDENILKTLNQRYIPNFKPADEEGYITLTTHNKTAQEINDVKLRELKNPVFRYDAVIQGDFPDYSYPTVAELELKKGAQVMFVKNDPSKERLFFNGKIGIITQISKDNIVVQCPGDDIEISVNKLDWGNIKYELDPETKEVKEKIIGVFTQFPLKLAWAITIHKSQGLTFEKAVIDANLAFAHGQVYVALSRCKSFEGMVLRSPISFNSVKTDGTVSEFTEKAQNNEPGIEQLNESRKSFQQTLLFDLFDFNAIKGLFFHVRKIAEDHNNILASSVIDDLKSIRENSEKDIYDVSENFKKQLNSYLGHELLPEDNEELQARVQKGCTYFLEKIDSVIHEVIKNLNTDCDNKAVRTSLIESIDNLQKEISIKKALMKVCLKGFSTSNYLKTKANAEIDYVQTKPITKQPAKVDSSIPHPELYNSLKEWRDALAAEWGVPLYMILAQKSILELVQTLPSNLQELETIKGLGKTKVRQYGDQILEIINDYCDNHEVDRKTIAIPFKEAKEKIDTKKVSFDLFKSGKSISDIAVERGFTTGTIEGHLAHFINTGEISVFDIVSRIKVAKIMAYIVQNPGIGTSEIKTALGDDVSYGELKAVLSHLTYIKAEEGIA